MQDSLSIDSSMANSARPGSRYTVEAIIEATKRNKTDSWQKINREILNNSRPFGSDLAESEGSQGVCVIS